MTKKIVGFLILFFFPFGIYYHGIAYQCPKLSLPISFLDQNEMNP